MYFTIGIGTGFAIDQVYLFSSSTGFTTGFAIGFATVYRYLSIGTGIGISLPQLQVQVQYLFSNSYRYRYSISLPIDIVDMYFSYQYRQGFCTNISFRQVRCTQYTSFGTVDIYFLLIQVRYIYFPISIGVLVFLSFKYRGYLISKYRYIYLPIDIGIG